MKNKNRDLHTIVVSIVHLVPVLVLMLFALNAQARTPIAPPPGMQKAGKTALTYLGFGRGAGLGDSPSSEQLYGARYSFDQLEYAVEYQYTALGDLTMSSQGFSFSYEFEAKEGPRPKLLVEAGIHAMHFDASGAVREGHFIGMGAGLNTSFSRYIFVVEVRTRKLYTGEKIIEHSRMLVGAGMRF